MIAKRPATRKYADRKSALVRAAIHLINLRGVSGMTMADVAGEMGLASKAVAYYFKKKEVLATECFLHGLRHLESFNAAGATAASPPDRLARMIEAYFDFGRRSMLGEVEELTSANDIRAMASADLNVAYGNWFRGLRALLVSDGQKHSDFNAKTHIIVSMLHWTPIWLPKLFPEDFARASDRVFDILLGGMAAPGHHFCPKALAASDLSPDPKEEQSDAPFLVAAIELINEQGYHGASVEKIAARLNLTKGAFYHHIEHKDELVVACFDRSFTALHRAIAAASSVSENGLQTLETLATALIERQAFREATLLRASAITTLPESFQRGMVLQYDRLTWRLASIVTDGIADGSIRPVDPNIAAQMIMALINTADELPYFARGITREQVIDRYVRPFFEGLFNAAPS